MLSRAKIVLPRAVQLAPIWALLLAAPMYATSCIENEEKGDDGKTPSSGGVSDDGDGSSDSTGGSATNLGGIGGDDADPMDSAGGDQGSGATGGTMNGTGGGADGEDDGPRTVQQTCARWNADRADLSEGEWSGSVETCAAGDISEIGRQNALRQYNLYRWLAGLPEVETTPERNMDAQACALLQEANTGTSHAPPDTWDCWTAKGYQASETSHITAAPGVVGVDLYMIDYGNENTLGHRRWILSHTFGPIGLGSTGTGASCMKHIPGTGNAENQWVAWPPPGPFPIEAYSLHGFNYGMSGWSFQSKDIVLTGAAVTMSSNGGPLPVTHWTLSQGFGPGQAIGFAPDGWQPVAGQTYNVKISAINLEIDYAVEMVSCE